MGAKGERNPLQNPMHGDRLFQGEKEIRVNYVMGGDVFWSRKIDGDWFPCKMSLAEWREKGPTQVDRWECASSDGREIHEWPGGDDG